MKRCRTRQLLSRRWTYKTYHPALHDRCSGFLLSHLWTQSSYSRLHDCYRTYCLTIHDPYRFCLVLFVALRWCWRTCFTYIRTTMEGPNIERMTRAILTRAIHDSPQGCRKHSDTFKSSLMASSAWTLSYPQRSLVIPLVCCAG